MKKEYENMTFEKFVNLMKTIEELKKSLSYYEEEEEEEEEEEDIPNNKMKDTLGGMTLKKLPYEVMVTGEKKYEYRDNINYWTSRFYENGEVKKYIKYLTFSHGYKKDRPTFKVEFKGIEIVDEVNEYYSNGFKVNYPYKKNGYYKISLGKIIKL
tara:strand:+ start:393 stop:857 length:465 start_codon:yes stop_codon:yes gene_type:complete